MGHSARLHERQKMKLEEMTLEEMISALERLQAIYPTLLTEQTQARDKIRYAISHLADKIWTETI